MTEYYYIGIGGTGARILSSIVRLCECGHLSLPKLNCVMIDADKYNGNVKETTDLIGEYTKVQKILGGSCAPLFKTEIIGIGKNNGFSATPISKSDDVERSVKGELVDSDSAEDVAAMKNFLTEEEYNDIKVNNGFYGNQLIGRIFFEHALEDSHNELVQVLDKIAKTVKNPSITKVKVYIACSTFGGTGASGIIPICNKLIDKVGGVENEGRAKLHIYASLMLPYFKPAEDEKIGKKIDHADFETTTYYALGRYRLLQESGEKTDKIFDKVHIVGDPSKPVRGIHKEEGTAQRNWPHIFELFAASEVKNAFDATPNDEARKKLDFNNDPFKVRNGDDISFLQWDDYTKYGPLRNSVERFLLLNYYFSTDVVPTLFNYKGDNKFESWSLAGKPNSNPNLARQRNREWSKRFTKLVGSIPFRVSDWNHDAIEKGDFLDLYDYFTQSSRWYYKLIHKFQDGSMSNVEKACWIEKPSSADTEATCSCMQTEVLLPNLFETNGAKKLAERACMPKAANFLTRAENFMTNVYTHAFAERIVEIDVNDIIPIKSEGEGAARSNFQKLVKSIYDITGNIIRRNY